MYACMYVCLDLLLRLLLLPTTWAQLCSNATLDSGKVSEMPRGLEGVCVSKQKQEKRSSHFVKRCTGLSPLA